MKISYNWLKEYINCKENPEELGAILTSLGLEVEGIEKYETVKGGMEGLVIGKILSCTKHPDADKLSCTLVDIGIGEPLKIVCGAPNVAEGQKVVVATINATLYKGDESFTIKKTKLRGELSEGMICSEDEIGIGQSHDGIIVLKDDVLAGTPAKDYYKIQTDTVFEIGLTPNRIDAGSHYGVARDIYAYFKQKGIPVLKKPDVSKFKSGSNKYPVKVTIEDKESCRRYAGVSVSGVTIKISPDWLQNRIKSIGLVPINNVVDITNFVLHELGQPLHAFDADKISGKHIIVKNMPEGTPFVTLDGKEHKLGKDDLMICDTKGPVAMAGIFGGLHSGVTGETTNIFIESAYFNPVAVRRTSRKHGINTDSSFRFERGADPDCTLVALKRAAMLIKEYAGGDIASEIVDEYPQKIEPHKIEVNYNNIDRLIGKKIDHELIKNILFSLEIRIVKETEEKLFLEVPPYRVDVCREADVIEEILRIYGYNNIEISGELHSTITHTRQPDNEKITNSISDYLSGNGFNEIMCNSLTSSAYYENLESFPVRNAVRIINPISNDLDVLRQTLLFGGLETIIHNINRQSSDLYLYEFGNCYFFDKENNKDILSPYKEYKHMGLFLTGRRSEPGWDRKEEKITFHDLKMYVENVLIKLGFNPDVINKEDNKKSDIYTYGLFYTLNNKVLAVMGMVDKQILNRFDIKSDVFFGEIYWNNILEFVEKHKVVFEELPKFPEVKRDLSLLLNKEVTYDKIKNLALKTERRLLKRINLFDVYEGERIEKGMKSYAISFFLQDKNSTLNDVQIDKVMNTLIQVFKKELNAEIR